MTLLNSFKKRSLKVNPQTFNSLALELFQYQANSCTVYSEYISHLGIEGNNVTDIHEIPCIPIDFFKEHEIKTENWKEKEVFQSSGTSGILRSRHLIEDPGFYLDNATKIFESMNPPLGQHLFFALLPSYQEQGDSSLVKMVDHFIKNSFPNGIGGFYLDKLELLVMDLIEALKAKGSKVTLFGVGYALLDLAEQVKNMAVKLDGLTIIETGGMKGRRKDMVKSEFYDILKSSLGDIHIQSEYGMTELMSQAYSINERSYKLPDQMKVLIRDPEDPFSYLEKGRTGGINIIDLANVHSCAFIETRDLGRLTEVGEFEILGRLDNSDIRGCNLLVI